LIKVTLTSGESIETTAGHPFYIQGKGWQAASTIKVGAALQLHNGTVVVVKTVDTSVRVERVYNLTVANTHNYFVGSDGVLVHNCKKPPLKPIHTKETLTSGSNKYSYEYWQKQSTRDILDSLKPGSEEPLRTKPDGRVFDGNTRVTILMERGIDVDSLPRVVIK